VDHDNITDIATYLRLCSAPHKRKKSNDGFWVPVYSKLPPQNPNSINICGRSLSDCLTVACAYLERLLANARVEKYLERNHVDTLRALRPFVADVRLGDTSPA
jgi:hypothetical protein